MGLEQMNERDVTRSIEFPCGYDPSKTNFQCWKQRRSARRLKLLQQDKHYETDKKGQSKTDRAHLIPIISQKIRCVSILD